MERLEINGPLSIMLDTKDLEKQLELQDIENYGLEGCVGRILVNSNGFMCDRPFSFDNLVQFLDQIKNINLTLKGEARLSHAHEDNYLE